MNKHQPILRNLTYNAAMAVQAIIAGDLRLAMEHLEDEIQRTKRVGVLIARDLSVERQVIGHATMMPIQPSVSPVDLGETPTPLDLTRIAPTGINWRETLTPVNRQWWERTDETTVAAAELEREYGRPLPEWAEWVAVDNDGFQFVYQEEPTVVALLQS